MKWYEIVYNFYLNFDRIYQIDVLNAVTSIEKYLRNIILYITSENISIGLYAIKLEGLNCDINSRLVFCVT